MKVKLFQTYLCNNYNLTGKVISIKKDFNFPFLVKYSDGTELSVNINGMACINEPRDYDLASCISDNEIVNIINGHDFTRVIDLIRVEMLERIEKKNRLEVNMGGTWADENHRKDYLLSIEPYIKAIDILKNY